MLRDPFAPPPAPRPMRLSELVETDLTVGDASTYAARQPFADPMVIPGHVPDDSTPFLARGFTIGAPFDIRGAAVFEYCQN
jgi:hypothetical protein